MYILTYYDDERDFPWLCFDTIEDGRDFLAQIPGYQFTSDELGIDSEWINTETLPDYQEIVFKGNKVPISRFMFKNSDKVELIFLESINLSTPNQGLIQGSTSIDAYAIPNEEVKTYVESREKIYSLVKSILEEKGMIVDRAYHGSEDGEAIIYKKEGENDWHFLTHLDPCLTDYYEGDERSIRALVNSWLG